MYETKNIKKETRSKTVLYRSETIKRIRIFIYESTGCERCRDGEFCSRDGDKWACCSYGSIADYLNSTGFKTSRGNKWETKTVRDQIKKGKKKVTPEQKEVFIRERNEKRNREHIWDTEVFDESDSEHDDLVDVFEDRAQYMKNVETIEDIDGFLETLRNTLKTKRAKGHTVTVVIIESKN